MAAKNQQILTFMDQIVSLLALHVHRPILLFTLWSILLLACYYYQRKRGRPPHVIFSSLSGT
jgi:hypothetical protein